jgi:hypothetical protein
MSFEIIKTAVGNILEVCAAGKVTKKGSGKVRSHDLGATPRKW